jgi:hypothetical protein
LLAGLVLMLAVSARAETGATQAMPRISVRGHALYAGPRPWRAWGMNWGIGDRAPVITYFDDPTAANLAVLRSELKTARRLGANSMRVYLQLAQVMATPTRARHRTLAALQRLLALAQGDRIYLDITGDLVWQPARAPAWYGALSRRARWQVQARFWRAVAHAASASAAVLCYELTSEPIVSQTTGYYYGRIGDWWFEQSIATAKGPAADGAARAWTRLLAAAVRSEDDRPVTIGLLPKMTGPFSPRNIADQLDVLTVHEYPSTGGSAAATAVVRSFATYGKPVLLGETFILDDDAPTEYAFLTASARYLDGGFEFFDGRDPATSPVVNIADAVYDQSLQQFIALRPLLLRT